LEELHRDNSPVEQAKQDPTIDKISQNLMSPDNMVYISGSDDDDIFDDKRSTSDEETVWSDLDTSADICDSPVWSPRQGKATGRPRHVAANKAISMSTLSSDLEELASPPSSDDDDIDQKGKSRSILRVDTSDSVLTDDIILKQSPVHEPEGSTATRNPITASVSPPHPAPPNAKDLRFRPPAFRLNPAAAGKSPPTSSPFADVRSSTDSTEKDDHVAPLPLPTFGSLSPQAVQQLAKKSHFKHLASDNSIHNNSPVLEPDTTEALHYLYPPPPSTEPTIPLATDIHTKSIRSKFQAQNSQTSIGSDRSGSIKSNTSDTNAMKFNDSKRAQTPGRSPGRSPPRPEDKVSPNNSRSPPRSRIDAAQMPRPRPTKSTVQNPYVYHTKMHAAHKSAAKTPNTSSHYLYHDSSLTPTNIPSPLHTDEPLRKCPPMSTAEYVAVDTGNATPRYMRMTTYAPPVNKTLHTATALPFVAHVTPFALPENDEMDIPLVDFGETSGGGEDSSDPIRCLNCECFINPHVSWVLGGEQWQCNLCCHRNPTPPWYFSPLRPNGRRADEEKGHRPELTFGSVDMKVSNKYCPNGNKSAQIPTFVFVLDVSPAARNSGVLGAELKAVKNTLDSIYEWLKAESASTVDENASVSDCSVDDHIGLDDKHTYEDRSGASLYANVSSAQATYGIASTVPDQQNTGSDTNGLFNKPSPQFNTEPDMSSVGPIRIGIVTFDSHVHFYSIREDSPDPIRVLMVDANDPFPPIPKDDWVFPLYHNKDKIDLILSSIPSITKPKNDSAPMRCTSAGSKDISIGSMGSRSTPAKETRIREDNTTSNYPHNSSLPPPPKVSRNIAGSTSNSTDNEYRMKQPIIEPIRISDKTTILPGKAGLLRPTHSSSDTKKPLNLPSVSSASSSAMPTTMCPVAAVEAVRLGLSEYGGGRVILMTSSNSTKGLGRTTRTPQSSDYGTEQEFPFYGALEEANEVITASLGQSPDKKNSTVGVDGTIYHSPSRKPATELDAYLELKKELVKGCICLEVFFFVPSLNCNASKSKKTSAHQQTSPTGTAATAAQRPRASNSAVFSELTRATGGNLHLFSGSLLLEDNLIRFNSELLESIQSIAASEVTMKLQCSNGLKATEYYGSGEFDPKCSSVNLAGLDRQSSSCFVLNFDSEGLLDVGGIGTSVAEAASDLGILDNISNLLKGIKPSNDSASFGARSNSPITNASLSSNSRAVRSSANRKKGIYNDGEPLYLQLSITYTAQPSGERIVRVHNMELITAVDPSIVFRYADCHCLTAFLCKEAAFKALRVPLNLDTGNGGKSPGQDIKNASGSSSPVMSHNNSSNSLIALSTGSTSKNKGLGLFRSVSSSYYSPRLFLIDSCLEILLKYRTLCSSHSPKGQLILPESLKVLPLYILGMLKHPYLLKNGHTNSQTKLAVDCCERAYELSKMLTQPVRDALFSLYPRLYPLHNLQPDEGYALYEEDEFDELAPVLVPKWLKCSAEVINSEGIYLLDDGTLLWLYIGRCVKQSVIKDLLGLSAGSQNPPDTNVKPTTMSQFTNNIVGGNKSTTERTPSGRIIERSTSGRVIDGSNNHSRASSGSPTKGGQEEKRTPTKSPHGTFLRSLSSGGDRPRRRSSRSSASNTSIAMDFNEDRDPSHSILPGFVGLKPLLNIESEYASRVTRIIDTVRESHTHKPELKIVWGGEVNANSSDVLRFGLRMIEDSIYGCQSYSDHLCEIHAKIQSML